jgi:hypothetical protein
MVDIGNSYTVIIRKSERRDHLEDLDIDALRRKCVGEWFLFTCIWKGMVTWLCDHGDELPNIE